MREIKFRVWDKAFKKMYDNDYWLYHSSGQEDFFNMVMYRCSENQFEIMQYTGLKDKNGIEIYEGDIVKYEDFSNGAYFSFSGKDIQPRKTSSIVIENLFNGIYLPGFPTTRLKTGLEVVGNIYQNPELL